MQETETQKRAIRNILTEVLQDIRPAEVSLVEHCFDRRSHASKSTPLGFGGGGEIVLFLPAILEVLRALATTSIGEFAKAWGKELALFFVDELKTPKPSAFAMLHKKLCERMLNQGVKNAEAIRVADATIAVLVSTPHLLADLQKAAKKL
jgi:hypothetical protein